jgi:hypothetical protein
MQDSMIITTLRLPGLTEALCYDTTVIVELEHSRA